MSQKEVNPILNPLYTMTKQQNKAMHALLRQLGYSKEEKKALVWSYSDGRTVSGAELHDQEAGALIAHLKSTLATREMSQDKTNARILAKIKSYGAKCCGYESGQKPDWKNVVIPYIVKVAKVDAWKEVERAEMKALQKLLYQLQQIEAHKEKKASDQAVNDLVGALGIALLGGEVGA